MLIAFTIGMTLATSSLNVFYRDVNPVVQISLQLWLYLTPVAYPLSAVHEKYRWFFLLNPLTAVVEGLRARWSSAARPTGRSSPFPAALIGAAAGRLDHDVQAHGQVFC